MLGGFRITDTKDDLVIFTKDLVSGTGMTSNFEIYVYDVKKNTYEKITEGSLYQINDVPKFGEGGIYYTGISNMDTSGDLMYYDLNTKENLKEFSPTRKFSFSDGKLGYVEGANKNTEMFIKQHQSESILKIDAMSLFEIYSYELLNDKIYAYVSFKDNPYKYHFDDVKNKYNSEIGKIILVEYDHKHPNNLKIVDQFSRDINVNYHPGAVSNLTIGSNFNKAYTIYKVSVNDKTIYNEKK